MSSRILIRTSRWAAAAITKQIVTNSKSNAHAAQLLPSRNFSRRKAAGGGGKKSPQSALAPVEEAWVPVTDKASGQVYWWNEQTNETTQLGAPKPQAGTLAASASPPPPSAAAPQGGSMLSGLGGVMAEGFAFGVGSSIARSVVGSLWNSGSGGDSGDGGLDL